MPYKRRRGEIVCGPTVVWKRRRMDFCAVQSFDDRPKRISLLTQFVNVSMKSQPTFATDSKKVRPGLTDGNRLKQVEFARHVFCNWNLAISENDQNTLDHVCLMRNEKWWYGYGLVLRTFAKMGPALGIDKKVFTCHHKKHIGSFIPNPNPWPNHNP
jgi:hypothetical protein